MAGQADKKRAKNAAESIVYYQGSFAVCTLLYLIAALFLTEAGIWGFGFWSLLEVGFFLTVSYLTFRGIESGLHIGADFSIYQDIYIINLFVQLGVAYVSRWFWAVYLLVPGYAAYKLWDFIKGWCLAPRGPEDPNGGKSKTQQKREARANKPQYKVMRG